MKNILKYSVFIGISALLSWYAFRNISFEEVIQLFKRADYFYVFLCIICTFIAHWSRAYRWVMLMRPLGQSPSVINANLALWTGYFANYIVPRMGEVSRCGTLQKTDGVPFQQSFGTVIAERIFDVITLLVLIVLNFALEFDRLSQFFLIFFQEKLEGKTALLTVMASLSIVVLVVIVLVIKNRNLRQKITQLPLIQKLWGIVSGFLDGLLSVRKLQNPLLFVLHTILIWAMYFLQGYLLFKALPETAHLGLLAGLTQLVIGAIGMTAPSQGGIGPYHLLVGNVMMLYGLAQQDGILLATFIHTTQLLLTLLVGGLAFLAVLFVQKKQSHANSQ